MQRSDQYISDLINMSIVKDIFYSSHNLQAFVNDIRMNLNGLKADKVSII